jgi:D-3-phosphoglycerate dehydrogenase / 2-oxoglutarate reductase
MGWKYLAGKILKLKKKILIVGESVQGPKTISYLSSHFDISMISTEQFEQLIRLPLTNTFAIWIHVNTLIRDHDSKIFSNLQYILSTTTGLSHIGPKIQSEFGNRIISLKGENRFLESITSTAEHAWAFLMHGASNLISSSESVREGNWNRLNHLRATQISSKTLGIIGFGRLGKIVANYGSAFGMNVLVNDIDQSQMDLAERMGYKLENNPDSLIMKSDFVSLHASYSFGDSPIIDGRILENLSKSLLLINTARAGLVDEESIIDTVRNNRNFRYYTDVLGVEDLGLKIEQSKLWQYSKNTNQILITPHIGGASLDAMHKCELYIARKFISQLG